MISDEKSECLYIWTCDESMSQIFNRITAKKLQVTEIIVKGRLVLLIVLISTNNILRRY